MNTQQFFIRRTIGFIIVLALAGLVFWVFKPQLADQQQPADGWKTSTNPQGVTFRYPEKLTTNYISTVDWPPQIAVTSGPFTCTEAGQETARAGKTEKRMVDNRIYCVTKVTEGAAGSIYTQYSYITTTGNNKLVNLTFSLRFVQCGNYDAPKKTECEGERETFDIDSVVDRIVKTI